MIEAIIFDFDGTLVDLVDSDTKSLKHLHFVIGCTSSFGEFLDTAVNEIMNFHNLVEQNAINPLLMHKFRLEKTFQALGMVWDDSALEIYKKELIRTCVPFHGVAEMLAGIKGRFKLGLISNAYDSGEQRERILYSGLEPYFDEILISGEVGIYKPDPRIFHNLLNSVGIAPERSLYVGDSIKHDVVGAKSAGMKSALFSQGQNRTGSAADYHVNSIKELKLLLDRI